MISTIDIIIPHDCNINVKYKKILKEKNWQKINKQKLNFITVN